MYITWHGHACFKIQTKNKEGQEIIIVIDPYDPKIGLKLPKNLAADLLLTTHDHYDHNYVKGVKGTESTKAPFVISSPGEYEVKDIFVYGIPAWHDKNQGKERGPMTLYSIRTEGISLGHLGDLGHILDDRQLERLEGVDILIIPVGGVYTIAAKEAAEIISQIEPKIIIPMHYKIPGLTVNIEGIEKFAKEMGVSQIKPENKLKITKKDLPAEEMKIVVMEKS